MKLDSRIKEGKRPLTCIDVEQAREFEGKQCLFSDSYVNYKNIREYAKYPQYTGVLHIEEDIVMYSLCQHCRVLHIEEDTKRFRVNEDYVFRNGTDGYLYSLVLPLEWVKPEEPKEIYRAFENHAEYKEYLEAGIIETWIQIREKASKEVWELMYTGGHGIFVCFGAYVFSLKNLFNDFELKNEQTGEWQPFGVIDEEGVC